MSVANRGRLNKALTAKRIVYGKLNEAYSRRKCQTIAEQLFAEIMHFGARESKPDAERGGDDAEQVADEFAFHAVPDWQTAFCTKVTLFKSRYLDAAVGPVKEEVLAKFLAARLASTSSDLMARVSAVEKRAVRRLHVELSHASEKLEGLRGELVARKDAAEKELESLARATEDAQRTMEYNRKMEDAKLEMKRVELARAREELKRLDGSYDFVLEKLSSMLESDDASVGILQEAYAQLRESTIGHEIAASNAPSQSGTVTSVNDESEAQILEARNEVQLMQEHTDLINRNIDATKEVLAIKHSELQECEFQWGMAKASVAHEEGEMMVLEEETAVLSSLVLKLKSHLQHRVTRALPEELLKQLDERQHRALRSLLPAGSR